MIGPEIPAHLLARQRHEDLDEEEDLHQPEPKSSIGPQMPSRVLQHQSTTADEDADEDDDDTAGPMPDTLSMSQSPFGKVSLPGPRTGRRPIGPERPHRLSHSHSTYNDDDDDDDDEIGPRPPPSGARQEEEDAVKRFMEVEETRRKKIEVSVFLCLNVQLLQNSRC